MGATEIAQVALAISCISVVVSIFSIRRANLSDFSQEKMVAIQEALDARSRCQQFKTDVLGYLEVELRRQPAGVPILEALVGKSYQEYITELRAILDVTISSADERIEALSSVKSLGFSSNLTVLRQIMIDFKKADAITIDSEKSARKIVAEFRKTLESLNVDVRVEP